MEQKVGVYFISTNTFNGKITQWVLGIDFDVLGFQMDSSIPGDLPFIYLFDLFSHQTPSWQKNSINYEQWKTYNYVEKNIYKITSSYITYSQEEEKEYESIKLEMKKFLAMYCFTSVNSNKENHWKSIINKEWNPIDTIPFMKYFINKNTTTIFSSTSVTNSFSSENEEFISLLMDQTKHYYNTNTNNSPPIPSSSSESSNKLIHSLDEQINQWCKTISNKGTVIIYLNQILQIIHSLIDKPLSPPKISKESSYPALVITNPLNKPTQLLIPKIKENDSYLISLSNPDLSILSEDQYNTLKQMLYSEEYLLNPLYDELRQVCSNSFY